VGQLYVRIPPEIDLPEKDLPVLATAIDAGCDILVTGDSRHFGPLFGRTLGRLKILSPVDTARGVLGHPVV
jgi:predicted nucleic acid-binding protein